MFFHNKPFYNVCIYPFCVNEIANLGVIYVYRANSVYQPKKEITMKLVATLIAAMFATAAMAQTAAPAKKEEAKPAAAAPAAKPAEKKAEPAKSEPAKKDEKKPAEPAKK